MTEKCYEQKELKKTTFVVFAMHCELLEKEALEVTTFCGIVQGC